MDGVTDPKDARIAELEARILALETVTDEDVERAAKALEDFEYGILSSAWDGEGRPILFTLYQHVEFPAGEWNDVGLWSGTYTECLMAAHRFSARAALSIRRGE